jgi:hypothetical protein
MQRKYYDASAAKPTLTYNDAMQVQPKRHYSPLFRSKKYIKIQQMILLIYDDKHFQ